MHRARHVDRIADPEEVVGMCINITLRSMRKVYDKFGATHIVACFDHRSWRKDVFEGYKASRAISPGDEDSVAIRDSLFEAMDSFKEFLKDKTNVTVLNREGIEADDFIARWIQLHPDDNHVIVSTDSDFKQLVCDNVELYDGVRSVLYRHDGVFLQDGKKPPLELAKSLYGETWKVKTIKGKSGEVTMDPETFDPKWCLFEKIMLGDSSDDIPRAAPKGMGPKKLRPAFEDYPNGLAWRELREKIRSDIKGSPTVGQVFDMNMMLVQLDQQPESIVAAMDQEILSVTESPTIPKTGSHLLAFCKRHRLLRIASEADYFAPMLASPYSS